MELERTGAWWRRRDWGEGWTGQRGRLGTGGDWRGERFGFWYVNRYWRQMGGVRHGGGGGNRWGDGAIFENSVCCVGRKNRGEGCQIC
jgi:hypothetical protein